MCLVPVPAHVPSNADPYKIPYPTDSDHRPRSLGPCLANADLCVWDYDHLLRPAVQGHDVDLRPAPPSPTLHQCPDFIHRVLPRHAVLDAEAAALFVLVVGADPVSSEQALRELETALHAGADVAAEIPHILNAVEGVEEKGQRESGVGHEVFLSVGNDVGVGDSVWGVENAHGFRTRGAVGGD